MRSLRRSSKCTTPTAGSLADGAQYCSTAALGLNLDLELRSFTTLRLTFPQDAAGWTMEAGPECALGAGPLKFPVWRGTTGARRIRGVVISTAALSTGGAVQPAPLVIAGAEAFSLMSYQVARPWAKAIKEEVLERRMPPFAAIKGFGVVKDEDALT